VFYDDDSLNTFSRKNPGIEPVRFAQYMPQFPGPEDALMKYLAENIQYPKKAMEAKIQGKVVLDFLVGMDGLIEKVQVIQGIGGGCDEEAIRVIKKMNTDAIRWAPGNKRWKGSTRFIYVTYHFQT
jgi:protein TonB